MSPISQSEPTETDTMSIVLPARPAIYEINTRLWLHELSRLYGQPITLANVPTDVWDYLAGFRFDAVWLMGVWERSSAGLAFAQQNENLRQAFAAALPDAGPEDIVGSPYCVRQYEADPAIGGRAASARPSVDTAMALPAEPALEGAPSLDAWKNAREVNVKGSDAHGCETKQAGEWIRIVCRPTERYGKLLDGSWIQGTDAISSYAVAGGGAVVLLLLRYVEGVDASAALGFEKSRAKLRINWPKGMALPQVRGQIDDLP